MGTAIRRAGARWLVHVQSGGVVVAEMPVPGILKRYVEEQGLLVVNDEFVGALKTGEEELTRDGRADLYGVDWKGNIRIVEIKVARSDFLAEQKSRKYEKYVHAADYFYYLTPPGLIEREELPAGAGWLEYDARPGYGIKMRRRPKRLKATADKTDLWKAVANALFNRYYHGSQYDIVDEWREKAAAWDLAVEDLIPDPIPEGQFMLPFPLSCPSCGGRKVKPFWDGANYHCLMCDIIFYDLFDGAEREDGPTR
jgi:hypothetical protein